MSDEQLISENFEPIGLTTQEAVRLLEQHGRNELVENSKGKLRLFVEQFTGPLPIGSFHASPLQASLTLSHRNMDCNHYRILPLEYH